VADVVTTAGDLLYGTAADTVARLGIGTVGQVLKVNSGATAPEWGAASAGALTLIKRASFSNVANTGTTFDDMFSTTYSAYLVSVERIFCTTGANDFHFQFRYAGPTTETTEYYGNSYGAGFTETALTFIAQNAASQLTLWTNVGISTTESSGQIVVTRVGDGSHRANVMGFAINGGDHFGPQTFGGMNNEPREYKGFIIKSSSTNVTGTIAVYGYQE
jgi:hypothetical protein